MGTTRRVFHILFFYIAISALRIALEPREEDFKAKKKDGENEEVVEEEEEEEEEGEEIVIPDVTPEDGWFIALGLPQEIHREGRDAAFTPDDPDWQDIVKLHQDREGMAEIRGEQTFASEYETRKH